MSCSEGRFIDMLPALQAVAARWCAPLSFEHPGQLAWSSIYEGRQAPAAVFGGAAYGFLETPGVLAVGGDPARAGEVIEWARSRSAAFTVMALDGPLAEALVGLGGVVDPDAPWFVQQTIDLSAVTVPDIPGYRVRHVERREAAARAACHRAAWSDRTPARMTGQMYRWLMDAPPYDAALDWVAVSDEDGEMVASCLAWVCGSVALVEPVGCAPQHRRKGLGGGVTLAALAAARERGAAVGIVRPRGDEGYPVPVLVYRSIGFTDRRRTREIRFTGR
jgi:GNAT superfamily N-acetyltransferase